MRPFLDILKEGSSSSMNLSTVRSLALKTFAHPQIFSGFDEFKNHCSPLIIPQTQNDPLSGADGPHTSLFNTLDLFSFGTLKDYNARQHTESEYYLPLNEQALAKLGQLTVLSSIQEACINGNTSISYDSISQALGLTGNDRAVEDVLIRCLYANVLKGRLCQKTRSFGWQGESLPVVSSRDVPPAQISNLLSALRGLEKRLEESRIGLASAQEEVTQGLEGTVQYWKSIHNEKSAHLKETLFKDGSSKGAMGGGEGPGSRRMDIRRQGTAGVVFPGGAVGSDAAQNNSLRRSSKRSRGGMATKLVTDAAGYRT
eukprot:jgi/Psemu1/245876/estExt_Genewise1.C_6540020